MNLLEFAYATERRFGDWSMRYVGSSPSCEAVIHKYMPAGFDPSVIPDGAVMVRMLRDLCDACPDAP